MATTTPESKEHVISHANGRIGEVTPHIMTTNIGKVVVTEDEDLTHRAPSEHI